MTKKLPEIVIHDKGSKSWESNFLSLRTHKFQLKYPNGSKSPEFFHDIVYREKLDAAVIVPYDLSDIPNGGQPKVWLRSCVRPAIASRWPFPNTMGNEWELPAGLVDSGESPEETAVRELFEETGFSVDNLDELGSPVWGSVGISSERLFFYGANVTDKVREKPSEDGSPLEKYGITKLVSLEEALESKDMKTHLGVLRLRELFAPLDKIRIINTVLRKMGDTVSPEVLDKVRKALVG